MIIYNPDNDAAAGAGKSLDIYRPSAVNTQSTNQAIIIPSSTGSTNTASFDLFKILSTLLHRKWTVIGITLLFAALALLISFIIKPVYRASATVEIARKPYQVVEFGTVVRADEDNEFYSTQYGLLKSPTLAGKVIKKLKLTATQLNTTRTKDPKKILKKKTIEELFLSHLMITPIPQSRLVNISFENNDPKLATKITNTLVESYILSNMEKKRSATSYTRDYLEKRVHEAKRKLETSELKLNDYASQNNIIKFDEDQKVKLAALKKLEEMLAEADGRRVEAQSSNQQAQSSPDVLAEAFRSSSVLQTLRLSKAQLEAEYQEKLQTFKPSYPGMLQLKKRINQLTSDIAAEKKILVRQTRTSAGNRYKTSTREVKKLTQKITNLQNELMQIQNKTVEFNNIKREVSSNQHLYNTLLKRLNEVTVASDAAVNNISVISQAYIPKKKIKPKRALNLAAGTLLGLFTGSLLALFLELTRGKIRNENDIKQLSHLPLLGSIPTIKSTSKKGTLLFTNRSALTEAFRTLRTNLTYAVGNNPPESILITSSAENEGKSTTALNLATAYARMGKNVLLIDGDMRKPSIGEEYFHAKNKLGLTDYLKNKASLIDITKSTDMPRLYIIPVGSIPSNPVELLATNRMARLVSLSEKKFDMVIIDSPPVLDISDSIILSSMVDATILVVKMNNSLISDVAHSLERLQHNYSSLLGVIATHTKAKYRDYGTNTGKSRYAGLSLSA